MGKRETTMACRSLIAFLGKPSSSLGEYQKDCQNNVSQLLAQRAHTSALQWQI